MTRIGRKAWEQHIAAGLAQLQPMTACQQAPDPESTAAYLALCLEALDTAIAWLLAASRDARVDESLCSIELKQLRGIRDAVQAEMEARNAQP